MIRITEQQLYSLISESIHRVLSEAKSTADEVYQKYYSDVDRKLFDAALKADPTTKNGYTGKYAKWLLNLARHGKWKAGDAPETKAALERFMRIWKNLEKKDIQQYDSIGELYDAVMQSEPQKTRKQTKADAEKVYEDFDWTVIVPKTEEAAKLYGKGTKWCTAADNNNMFEYYNENGPLYILISKKDGNKFQIHFSSNQYMDAEDEPFGDMNSLARHGDVKGLTNFLKSKTNKVNFQLFPDERTLENLDNYLSDMFNDDNDRQDDIDDVYTLIDLFKGKYHSVDIFNILLQYYNPYALFSKEIKIDEDFEIVYAYDYGYNLLWHTMNDTNELLSKQWFDRMWKPSDDSFIMLVMINTDFNYINHRGQLLLKQNATEAQRFSDGIGVFYNEPDFEPCFLFPNGKQINTNLKMCDVEPFKHKHPYTLVSTTRGEYTNLIDCQGKLRFKEWFGKEISQFDSPDGWYVHNSSGEIVFLDARTGEAVTPK